MALAHTIIKESKSLESPAAAENKDEKVVSRIETASFPSCRYDNAAQTFVTPSVKPFLVGPKTFAFKNETGDFIRIGQLNSKDESRAGDELRGFPCDQGSIILGLGDDRFAVVSHQRLQIASLKTLTYEHTINFKDARAVSKVKLSRDNKFLLINLIELDNKKINHLWIVNVNTLQCINILPRLHINDFDLIRPGQLALIVEDSKIQICHFDLSMQTPGFELTEVTQSDKTRRTNLSDIWTGFGPNGEY